MDLPYIGWHFNVSYRITSEYINEHPAIAFFVLIVLFSATIIGSIGNLLVIGAVLSEKVCTDDHMFETKSSVSFMKHQAFILCLKLNLVNIFIKHHVCIYLKRYN